MKGHDYMNKPIKINQIVNLISCDLVTPILNIIWYGSRAQDGDIDLLVITESDPNYPNFSLGKLDISIYSNTVLDSLSTKADIVITDPILTGTNLFGNGKRFEKIKNNLKENNPCSSAIIDYLIERAIYEYVSSMNHFNQFNNNPQKIFLLNTLVNLSFSYSYFYSSEIYRMKKVKEIITYSQLLDIYKNEPIADLSIYLKKVKRNPSLLDTSQIYNDSSLTRFIQN